MNDYLTQVVHQLEQTRAELRRAEDELATHRQRACHETRLRAAWRSARRRARTADRQARDWRQANRFNVGIYDQATARAQQAEDRVAAVRSVLGRYMGCASDQAAALRAEIRAAIDGPAEQPPACCICGSTEVVYRNYRDKPFCCSCAKCCPKPEPGP